MRQEGFKVKMHGRAGIEYVEGGKTMMIDSEMLAGPDFDLVIYRDSMCNWEPPDDMEEVTPELRSQIQENIRNALRNVRIDWQ